MFRHSACVVTIMTSARYVWNEEYTKNLFVQHVVVFLCLRTRRAKCRFGSLNQHSRQRRKWVMNKQTAFSCGVRRNRFQHLVFVVCYLRKLKNGDSHKTYSISNAPSICERVLRQCADFPLYKNLSFLAVGHLGFELCRSLGLAIIQATLRYMKCPSR